MDIKQDLSYHSLSTEEALKKVGGKKDGLSSEEAKERQEKFGKNILPKKKKINPLLILIKQFKDFLILILFIAAGVAFWANQMADVYIIVAVILFNAIMGFTQEYKAEKAIEAIKSLEQKNAVVLRNGKQEEIPAEDVVPGDIMLLKEGHTIPADGRLLEAKELRTAEASLTGESMPINKNTETLEEEAPLGDRVNMAWKSTNVVNGKGKAVVTAIGKKTEIGKIAKSMGEMEMKDSNFRKKTGFLGKQMAVIAIITSAVIFSLGYWVRDYDFQEILLVTIAVLVSTIPEGLPAVISIVLAIGAKRMADQKALIREFTATEMMGSVSVILTDKTGTLTQSILVIKKLFTGSGKEIQVSGNGYELEGTFKEDDKELDLGENKVAQKLLVIAAFCNDAHLKGEEKKDTGENDYRQEKDGKEKEDEQVKEKSLENKEKQKDESSGARKDSEKEVSDASRTTGPKALASADKEGSEEKEPLENLQKEEPQEPAKKPEEKEKDQVKADEKSSEQEKNINVSVDVQPDQVKINVQVKKDQEQEKEGASEKKESNADKENNLDLDVDAHSDQVKINIDKKIKKQKPGEEPDEDENRHIEEEEEEEELEEEKDKKDEKSSEDSDEKEEEDPEVIGDPTEAAMFVIGKKAGIKEKEPFSKYQLLDDLPFKSEQKFRASLVETENGPEIFAIGAPERILELSSTYLIPEGPKDLDDQKRKELQEKMDEWADQAMRVLALGYKEAENKQEISPDDVENMTWVGITGIIDPAREGVKESIEECKSAGIRVIMVTGDHKKTAAAIARDVGILDNEDKQEQNALTTKELEVDDEEFDRLTEKTNVFARMNPDTKLRIAERLQARDTLIAMTGDGVNDAPALKRADVGIAMGIRGTDVAKDASDIVLQDDNFSSIVNAIKEGRIVFNNVKITSYFLLTTNFAFAIAFIFGMSIGWPLLFTAAQILYVNLITDGIMDVALATESGHGDIMKQPPVKKSAKILHWDITPYLIVVSVVMVSLTLLSFWYYLDEGEVMARTAAFIVVSSTQLFNAYNMRSLRLSVFEIGVFSNKWVNIAFVAAVILQVLVIKVSAFRDLFNFENLPFFDITILLVISALIVGVGELYKYFKFKKKLF